MYSRMDRKPQRMTVKFLLTLSPVPVTQIVYLALRKKNPKKIIITLLSISVIASDATRVTGFGRISKLLHEIIGAFEDSLEMKKRKKEPGPEAVRKIILLSKLARTESTQ
ncbi:BnaC08g02580D [Brassica napus]|uniref:(rape) hypothetical protein n=1 Tax=Brassica napus TaxID=3708 RepID=A0A078H4P1_BRANA|nr:unnamed protein product [Brassica napus]CDY32836.1 BnaC08g02580D [Brassica napus]